MNQKIKNAICFILTIITALSVGTIPAFAEDSEEGKIHSFVPKVSEYYEGAEDYIAEHIRNLETNIEVKDLGISAENLMYAYKSAVFTNPDIFYVDASYVDYSYSKSDGIVYYIKPRYIMTESEIKTAKTKFNKAVKTFTDDIEDSWSDMRKSLILHDRLIKECVYSKSDGDISYTAYGALVNKKAVCEGYSRAYCLLLSKVGVESKCINNESAAHCWNMVKAAGDWYHVDVTSDDPAPDSSGYVLHKYFLISYPKLNSYQSSNHTDFRSDVSYSSAYSSMDESYDDSFFRNIKSEIYYCDGSYYYINNKYKGKAQSALIKRTGDTVKALKVIKDVWYNSKGDEYTSSFSKLCYRDGFIYFNSKREIYRYKLSSGKITKVFTMPSFWSNDFYGVKTSGSYILADKKKQQAAECAKSKILSISDGNKVLALPFIRYKSKTVKLKKTYVMTVYRGSGTVKYKSSNPKIAKVNSKGEVKALKKGSCTITAVKNGMSFKCKIKVVK